MNTEERVVVFGKLGIRLATLTETCKWRWFK
jgi:hypothetical protein